MKKTKLTLGVLVLLACASEVTPAWSGPAYCPVLAGKHTVPNGNCGERWGDLLIALHGNPPLIVGLHAATRSFYIFNSTLPSGSAELGDIAAVPSNPMHTVVIGNVAPDGTDSKLGVRELDGCGQLLPAAYGTFPYTLSAPFPPLTRPGFNTRGLVFNPLDGSLTAPAFITTLLDGTQVETIFSFPAGGGMATPLAATGALVDPNNYGAVASDEDGNLYLSSSAGAISTVSGSSLRFGQPIETSLVPLSPQLDVQFVHDMVYDGSGRLFLTAEDHAGSGKVVSVDVNTGHVAEVSSTSSATGAPWGRLEGITLDEDGNLWLIETPSLTTTETAVIKLSRSVPSELLDVFPIPDVLQAFPVAPNRPYRISVLGQNPAAVRERCNSQCAANEISDCSNQCVPADWLNDSICDANLTCYARGFDAGFTSACSGCPDGQLPDCNGNCALRTWIGDEICDQGGTESEFEGQLVSFNCSAFRYDESTCQSCAPDETLDCDGHCAPTAWLGDSLCDDGTYSYDSSPINFDCAAHDFDEETCE